MQRALILAALLSAQITASTTPASAPQSKAATEPVEIKTQDGQLLKGIFFKPGKERAPAALLVHDAGADRKQLEPFVERLGKLGFGVLAVDLRGHGESKSAKLDWSKLSESEREAVWSFGLRDVDAAADWLLEQPSIHSTSLSLIGYGAGCALVARHARSDENVVCMALLAPRPEEYGFDVKADIQILEGLDTFVVTTKDEEAERMVEEANALAAGNPYIELFFAKPKQGLLEDKSVPSKVASWLGDKALPKKGRVGLIVRPR
jgi:dienelactone hydrolase